LQVAVAVVVLVLVQVQVVIAVVSQVKTQVVEHLPNLLLLLS
jgi:hypothetical protein